MWGHFPGRPSVGCAPQAHAQLPALGHRTRAQAGGPCGSPGAGPGAGPSLRAAATAALTFSPSLGCPPLLLKSHRKTPEGWKIVLIKDRRPPSCSLLEKLPETKVSFVFRGPSRAWGHESRAPLTRWTHGFRSWSWAGGGVAGGLPCTVGAELVSALQTTTDWHHWGGGWSQRHRAVPWDVKVLKAPRGVSGPFCTAQCL